MQFSPSGCSSSLVAGGRPRICGLKYLSVYFFEGFDQMPCQARPGAAGAPAPDQAVGKCTPPALARESVMLGAIPRSCGAVCHGHCALRTSPLAVVMCRCAEYQLRITHRLKLASLHIFFELPPLMKPPGTENQRPKTKPTPAAPALSQGRGCPGSGIRTTTVRDPVPVFLTEGLGKWRPALGPADLGDTGLGNRVC